MGIGDPEDVEVTHHAHFVLGKRLSAVQGLDVVPEARTSGAAVGLRLA